MKHILKSYLIGMIFLLFFTIIATVLLYYTNININVISFIIISFTYSIKIKKKGLICGLITGIITTIILFTISIIIDKHIIYTNFIKYGIGTLSSITFGIIGVNLGK